MLQEFMENLGKNVSETAETFGKKTETFLEIQKLKTQIHTAKREIAQNFEELGEMVYRRYKAGEETDEHVKAVCEDITELKAEIASYKEEISRYRGENVCPGCGAGVPKEAAFCMKCGAPMPVEEEDVVEEPAAEEPQEEPEEDITEDDFIDEDEPEGHEEVARQAAADETLDE